MSEKEKKKTFSRKILFLSNFRKNKKLNRIKEEHGTSELSVENGSATYLESPEGLDTTLCLDSFVPSELGAAGGAGTTDDDDPDAALGLTSTSPVHPAKSERRSFSNLRSVAVDHPDVLRHLNSPGIQRFQNANPMSVSNDSGIDCNVLLSERTSPEQFVAFTRRESERIRHEQFQNLNESVLETLAEVSGESKGTDDNDATNVVTDVCESVTASASVAEELTKESPVDTLQAQIDKTKKEVDLLAELKAVLSEKLDAVENGPCERETLPQVCPESADAENNNDIASVYTGSDGRSDETSQKFVESFPDVNAANLTSGNNVLDSPANKTDETKTEEVRKRLEDELRESQLNGLQVDVPHSVVSPIPMTLASSVPASHRALNATKVSGTLIPNEKSAFAKCKSIKRSVSDVGKGILGKFRHKKRDHNSSRDDSCLYDTDSTLNSTKTRFKKSRSLRFSKSKKHQLFSSSQISLDDTAACNGVSIRARDDVDIFSRSSIDISRSERSGDFSLSESNISRGERKLKSKPLQSSSPRTDDIRNKRSKRGRRSRPVGEESIQDFTLSICEMTSALLGHSPTSGSIQTGSQTSGSIQTGSQTNSIESIACACDCKKRNSDPLCCEKRKTPSPVDTDCNNSSFCDLVNKHPSSIPVQNRYSRTNNFTSISSFDLDKSVRDLDASYLDVDGAGDEFVNGEVDTESDSECSDSDCSECRSNRGYRGQGKSTTDTSSSDTTPRKCRSPVCDIDTAAGRRLSDVGSSQSSSCSDSRPSTPERCHSSSRPDIADCVQSPYSVSFTELNEENSRYFESKLNSSHMFNNQSFHEVYSDGHSPMGPNNVAIGGSRHFSPCVFPCGDTPASSPANDSLNCNPNSPSFAASPNTHPSLNESVDICRRKTSVNRFNVNDSICLARRGRFSSHHDHDTSINQSVLDHSLQNSSIQNHSFNNSLSFSLPHRESVHSKNRNSVRKDILWVERHIGQVYSPAKRVLHKNRGLSESDLCKQILDLYVSDADESGLEPHGSEMSFDESFSQSTQEPVSSDDDSVLQFGTYVAPRHVVKETNIDDFSTSNIPTCYTAKAKTRKLQGDSSTSLLQGDDRRQAAITELKLAMQTPLPASPDDVPMSRSLPRRNQHSLNTSLQHDVYSQRLQNLNCSLQHITSAGLNTSLKTLSKHLNTSLQQMSTSDLRTSRKKVISHKPPRSRSANSLLSADQPVQKHSRERAAMNSDDRYQSGNSTVDNRDQCRMAINEDQRVVHDRLSQFPNRPALKDRTNTKPVHLSSLQMPSVRVSGNDVKTESLPLAGKENEDQSSLSDHQFDRLTLLHTVHNGRQKVRCLSLREAQTVVKHYPPPKEASAISWGQNLSEVDLSRHTPMKAPLHTKPILLQRGEAFPYNEDRPSPIVITKKRKLKVSSKKYKKWPW